MNNQNVKTKTGSNVNVKLITMTAMFAALVTVTTAFIKIPSPLGYSHAGDSMIYLGASVLPGPFGIIAASIGGALADAVIAGKGGAQLTDVEPETAEAPAEEAEAEQDAAVNE